MKNKTFVPFQFNFLMQSNLSIKSKLIAIFSCILFLVIVLGSISIFFINRIGEGLTDTIRENIDLNSVSNDVSSVIQNINSTFQNTVSNKNISEIVKLNRALIKSIDDFKLKFSNKLNSISNAKVIELLEEIENSIQTSRVLCNKIHENVTKRILLNSELQKFNKISENFFFAANKEFDAIIGNLIQEEVKVVADRAVPAKSKITDFNSNNIISLIKKKSDNFNLLNTLTLELIHEFAQLDLIFTLKTNNPDIKGNPIDIEKVFEKLITVTDKILKTELNDSQKHEIALIKTKINDLQSKIKKDTVDLNLFFEGLKSIREISDTAKKIKASLKFDGSDEFKSIKDFEAAISSQPSVSTNKKNDNLNKFSDIFKIRNEIAGLIYTSSKILEFDAIQDISNVWENFKTLLMKIVKEIDAKKNDYTEQDKKNLGSFIKLLDVFNSDAGKQREAKENYLKNELQINKNIKQFQDLSMSMQAIIDEIHLNVNNISKDSIDSGNNNLKLNKYYVTFLIIIIVMISAILGLFTIYTILSPILKLKQMVVNISKGEGDLTTRLVVKNNDEIGDLANAFNAMIESLRKLLLKILETSTNIYISSNTLHVQTQQQFEGLNGQIKSLETTAVSYEKSNHMSNRMHDNIKNLVQLAEMSNSKTNEGSMMLEKLIAGVKVIENQVSEISKKIINLDQKSQSIEEIIRFINGISSQTNLLALNAAIEAARAGRAGLGFAVVADEVKKLSEESDSATKEIQKILIEIQKDIAESIKSTNKGITSVNEGINLINLTRSNFGDINEYIAKTNSSTKQLYEFIAQQESESKIILDAMNEIGKISRINSVLTNDTFNLISKLKNLGIELNQDIKKFKLE